MGLHLACITRALWTKRGEHGVSRKIPRSPPLAHKVPVMRARLRHDSSLVWQFFNDRGEFPREHVASPIYIPPFPFPYQRLHYSGVSFQAWQFKFFTNLSTHSLQKSTLLSFEQSLQCHLVPGMGLTPQPSHWKSKISIVMKYIIHTRQQKVNT